MLSYDVVRALWMVGGGVEKEWRRRVARGRGGGETNGRERERDLTRVEKE